MTPLIIKESEYTPAVSLDIEKFQRNKIIFEISGESKPEDVKAFYAPILQWLDDFQKYLKNIADKAGDSRKRKIRLKFRMTYFNSSSAKYLFDIIQKMEELHLHCPNANAKVVWIYDDKDEDIFESGKEFKSMTKVPFRISTMKQEEKNL